MTNYIRFRVITIVLGQPTKSESTLKMLAPARFPSLRPKNKFIGNAELKTIKYRC